MTLDKMNNIALFEKFLGWSCWNLLENWVAFKSPFQNAHVVKLLNNLISQNFLNRCSAYWHELGPFRTLNSAWSFCVFLKATFTKILTTFELQQRLTFHLNVNPTWHNHKKRQTILSFSKNYVSLFVLEQDNMASELGFLFGKKVLEELDSLDQDLVALDCSLCKSLKGFAEDLVWKAKKCTFSKTFYRGCSTRPIKQG